MKNSVNNKTKLGCYISLPFSFFVLHAASATSSCKQGCFALLHSRGSPRDSWGKWGGGRWFPTKISANFINFYFPRKAKIPASRVCLPLPPCHLEHCRIKMGSHNVELLLSLLCLTLSTTNLRCSWSASNCHSWVCIRFTPQELLTARTKASKVPWRMGLAQATPVVACKVLGWK